MNLALLLSLAVCLDPVFVCVSSADGGEVEKTNCFLVQTVRHIKESADSCKRTFREWTRSDVRLDLEEAQALRQARAYKSAEYIRKNFEGKRVVPVMLLQPGMKEQEDDFAYFKNECGKKVLVSDPVYLVGDVKTSLPDDTAKIQMLNNAFLNSLEKRADVIVVFAALPVSPDACKELLIWNWGKDDAKVIFTNVPEPLVLKRKYLPDPVAAFILRKTENSKRIFPDDDRNTAFREKYLFVTEKNADEIFFIKGDAKNAD